MAYVTSIKNGLEVKFSLFILAGNLMCGKKYAQKVFSPEPQSLHVKTRPGTIKNTPYEPGNQRAGKEGWGAADMA
jgi:hypothetical protein